MREKMNFDDLDITNVAEAIDFDEIDGKKGGRAQHGELSGFRSHGEVQGRSSSAGDLGISEWGAIEATLVPDRKRSGDGRERVLPECRTHA
jgi:hypothetical protein